MRILAIGDVVATPGVRCLSDNISKIIRENKIDFCIVNGENASNYNGISIENVEEIFKYKVDCITLGNHAFSNNDSYKVFKKYEKVIRPINYPEGTPGKFYMIKKIGEINIAVINALGRVFMNNQIDCPFRCIDKLLNKISKHVDVIILDFHAEATSEKIAIGNYFDGRINMIFGTHTHVQTNDVSCLPLGSLYITDIGMTGVIDSVLGVKKEIIIKSFLAGRHVKHEKAEGKAKISGVIFEYDENKKKNLSLETFNFSD